MGGVFVTGTDTDCGKTYVSTRLIDTLRASGISAVGYKPVAAGATLRDGKLQNDDALALMVAGTPGPTYAEINPWCFAPPISPHIAAAEAGVQIDPWVIKAGHRDLMSRYDYVVTEGAGGWLTPLAPRLDIGALAQQLGQPVLLVVGLRLGCLNHALLTERAILAGDVPLLGWVATQVDAQMARAAANLRTLRERLASPCLGVLGNAASPEPLHEAEPLHMQPLL